ncbi:MazF family transcriptional regulator [Kitasatospora sp. MMS16-BH015]|nr:MazF family transcriptional regulator [Kitasatospora sp. MMS16-BH015]
MCAFPWMGTHPAVVLAANGIAQPPPAVTVALITDTPGLQATRVALGPDSGLTRYDEPYVDCTSLHTVAKTSLRLCRGRLDVSEMASVEHASRRALGLQA